MLTLTPANRLRGRQLSNVMRAKPAATHAFSDTLDMMGAPTPFGRNQEIYGDSEPADYLYAVVSGAVRTYKVLDDGRRQITAFYLPSDIFGLEFGDEHESSAEAVSDTTIRVFKRSAILALARRDGEVARQLWEMTARELHRTQDHLMLLIKSAQERVVSSLLEMVVRTSGTNERGRASDVAPRHCGLSGSDYRDGFSHAHPTGEWWRDHGPNFAPHRVAQPLDSQQFERGPRCLVQVGEFQ